MKKQHKFALSILTASLFAATSATAADTDSPFSVPLYLTNPAGMSETRVVKETTPVTEKVYIDECPTSVPDIPNIMLYLDDSGSMCSTPEGKKTQPGYYNACYAPEEGINGKQKKKILKDVLTTKILAKYGSKANWGVEYLNKNVSGLNITSSYADVEQKIKKMVASGTTPFLTGYVRAVNRFDNGVNGDISIVNNGSNYIIVMTDGAANADTFDSINNQLRKSDRLSGSSGEK